MQMTCRALQALDRNFALPRLDGLLDSRHMHCHPLHGVNVDLRGMQLGDQGARAVAQALQLPRYNAVLRLNLGSNCITDDGAVILAAAMATCTAKIKRVSLDGNRIGDRGARALMSAAASHETMVELDLHNNCLTSAGMLETVSSKSSASNRALQKVFVNWQLPSPDYMRDMQKHLNYRMRCILIDWMTDVAHRLTKTPFLKNDCSPCFFLSVSCLDRYLSQRLVQRSSFQLVGTACLMVAVLHCEKWATDSSTAVQLAEWLAEMTDNAYTPVQVKETADDIRSLLLPELEQPTLCDFLMRHLTWTGHRQETILLVEYLLSLAALSYTFVQYPPHVLAAAAVLLSHDALETMFEPLLPNWYQRLLRCSGVNLKTELIPCAEKLADLHASVYCGVPPFLVGHRGPGKLAAPGWYSTRQFLYVSKVPPTRPSVLRSPLPSFETSAYVVKHDSLPLWKSCDSWETFGRLSRGERVSAAGVPRKVDRYEMLPVAPRGAVEMRFLRSVKQTTATPGVSYRTLLLLRAEDWTLHGAKRRRCAY